ncbi:MAG TPA: nickel-type superoxide dismutase maturation protease [Acidimicrobiales bacterium]|nr:nickel-type superoxide dismutase maturation protease [Acidimicrobiales bacterium]
MSARHVLLVTVVTALAAVSTFLRRVEVRGDSMLPALRPGDRLLVVRTTRARPGQIVLVDDPRRRWCPLVKRVETVHAGMVVVTGDNTAASTDSRVFGPVKVRSRAVYRYHPAGRTGWLR